MRLRKIGRRATGFTLSATVLAGTAVAAFSGALPMQLSDSTSATTTSQVTLPQATSPAVPKGEIFGLCTAYLNHVVVDATTTTTAPSSTTTSSTTSSTTTAPTTTSSTTTAPTTTSSTTTAPTTTTSSSGTTNISGNLQIPAVLSAFAAAHGESVLKLCTSVNPAHAHLKILSGLKVDSDESTTTTAAPSSTTTTVAPTSTTAVRTDDKTSLVSGDTTSSSTTTNNSNVDVSTHDSTQANVTPGQSKRGGEIFGAGKLSANAKAGNH